MKKDKIIMMNKYKMAVSCGKGFGIVKTIEKTWFDIVTKLSKQSLCRCF